MFGSGTSQGWFGGARFCRETGLMTSTSSMTLAATPVHEATRAPQWWREAVFYQIYPRSFADSDGDGLGDLPGITANMDHLRNLGVDALR